MWKTGHELWSQVALVSAYFAADYLSLPCCFSLPSPGFFTLVNWVRAEAPLVDQASSCLSSDPHATPRSCAFMIVPFCRGGNRLRGVRELAWSPRAGNGWTGLQSLVCWNLFFVIPAHLPCTNTDLLWLSAWLPGSLIKRTSHCVHSSSLQHY